MRIRVVIVALLALASTVCVAQEIQSPTDWPPKAVPGQQKGKVPDFKSKNAVCLDCHGDIMEVKTVRKDIPNLHRLHLESKKVAYEGKNRDCLTCHEMIAPSETKARKKEGWFVKGDVYHPNSMQNPQGVWKKLIVRAGGGTSYAHLDALQQAEPHPFKPTLKRLVCTECHGPDSKVKTFYGAPEARK